MSESKAHFKVKKDNIEIEYDGNPSEVDARFQEILSWIKTPAKTESSSKKHLSVNEENIVIEGLKKGKYKKGVTPAIKEMVNGNFLDEFKPVAEILKELNRNNVTSSENAVRIALNRMVPKILERDQDEKEVWRYRKKR